MYNICVFAIQCACTCIRIYIFIFLKFIALIMFILKVLLPVYVMTKRRYNTT